MSESAGRFVLALSTAGSGEQAEQLARALVERRLAACVNIVSGVCSFYHWKGEVARDEELLLLIKTSRERFPDVQKAIRELHSYEVPEIIMLPIEDGDPDYLGWLGGELKGG